MPERTRLAVIILVALAALMILLGFGAVVSSRDNTAVAESGPELGEVSLTPEPEQVTSSSPASRPTSKTQSAKHVKPGVPQRLRIGEILVDAPVERVGVLSDGSQAVPESFDSVGWFKDGALPGQPGNAVFVGHTWSKGDSVFDRLPKLVEGDVIWVDVPAGTQRYRVVSVGSVTPREFAKVQADIYRRTGQSGIVLMTCGDFDPAARVYRATTVVYATRVS